MQLVDIPYIPILWVVHGLLSSLSFKRLTQMSASLFKCELYYKYLCADGQNDVFSSHELTFKPVLTCLHKCHRENVPSDIIDHL